jgi:hypothetical protein
LGFALAFGLLAAGFERVAGGLDGGVPVALAFVAAGFALAPSRFALRRSGRERGSEDSTSLPSDPFDMRA